MPNDNDLALPRTKPEPVVSPLAELAEATPWWFDDAVAGELGLF